MAFVTDDRRGAGLMLRDSVSRNLVGSIIRRVSPMFVMSPAREQSLARRAIQLFDVRPARTEIAAGALSGGNQQKVVLAKEVMTEPRLLLLDEPTRGVDVGAKGEIYARIRGFADQGLGVLIASSEMPELLGLCDRVVVLRGGRALTNYDAGSIQAAEDKLRAQKLPPVLMVDCSHANSEKKFAKQEEVWRNVIEQRVGGTRSLIGLMVESHLHEGSQPIPQRIQDLRYGVSITDSCIGWEATERMLRWAHEKIAKAG